MAEKHNELRKLMQDNNIDVEDVSRLIHRRISTVVTWLYHQEREIPPELLELLKYKIKFGPIR